MTKENKNFKILTIVLIVILAVLIITNAITAYVLYVKDKPRIIDTTGLEQQRLREKLDITVDDEIEEATADSQSYEEPDIVSDDVVDTGSITVDWYDNRNMIDIGAEDFFEDNYNQVLSTVKTSADYAKETLDNSQYYKVGKIKNGSYQGRELYLVIPMMEMGSPEFLRVVKDGSKYVVLANHSAEIYGVYREVYLVNDTLTLENLEPAEKINIPNSSIDFIKAPTEPFTLYQDLDAQNLKPLFKYNASDYVYQYKVGDRGEICFFVIASDGTVREYEFDLLYGEKFGIEPARLPIVWANGQPNSYEFYKGTIGGCGVGRCYHYTEGITEKDLVKAGSILQRYSIYDLRDSALVEEGISYLRRIYDQYYPGYDSGKQEQMEKIPYEDFMKEHPVIFWQDPFGNFVEFRNMKFIPAVECGKPVIYLYPEKEMDVSVKVDPNGGFSITEPDYNSGWYVKASPDGRLFNYVDKTYYPYLFWEGKGMFYQRPEQGFVIARDDVEKFLWEKLALLGLNKNESEEFVEFWLPRMQDRNYYFITFVPQSQFDKLAPLTIEPKPDTVIRVFMDYEGLDYYKKVEEQKIVTPERKGFTVVEWGGALHK